MVSARRVGGQPKLTSHGNVTWAERLGEPSSVTVTVTLFSVSPPLLIEPVIRPVSELIETPAGNPVAR